MAAAASVERFEQGGVRGFLHRVPGAVDGLVITHGAGGDCEMALLKVVAEAFVARGVTVLRCDLAFRQKGKMPSPSTGPADRASLREAVEAMRALVSGRVFLGGQSYGGRQASMLAAEDAGVAAGLLLLSYPLHPPGKPEQLRTAHFPQLAIPSVFVHGKTDPFATSEELRAAIALIPAPVELIDLDGAGHDLKRGKIPLDGAIEALVNR
ncbi:MAG: alpha/beta hydrolase [Acidobacteria bacterium]|nr:alpha/beta hydrolase [Acidobacteriota bacterium]